MKGIYALVICLNRGIRIKVGALGSTDFLKGTYVYVGSAQANLEQRVARHLRREKRLFWHIDYLLNNEDTKIEKVLHMEGGKSAECTIASEIGTRGKLVSGFGCSDCQCKSHLFRVEKYDFLLDQMQEIKTDA